LATLTKISMCHMSVGCGTQECARRIPHYTNSTGRAIFTAS
jgi:hypothetical protein